MVIQALPTDKYPGGIPADSRVATSGAFLKESDIGAAKMEKIRKTAASSTP